MDLIRYVLIAGILTFLSASIKSQTNSLSKPLTPTHDNSRANPGFREGARISPLKIIESSMLQAAAVRHVQRFPTALDVTPSPFSRVVLPLGGGAFIQPQTPIPTSGLVVFFDMFEGANSSILYDKSVNGFNGSIGSPNPDSPPVWSREGLVFNGVSNCARGEDGEIVFGKETVSAATMIVFYREETNEAIAPLLEFVADEQGGTGPNGQMGIVDFGGATAAWFQPTGSEDTWYWTAPTDTTPAAPGSWHSFGFTWRGGQSAKVYWDGALVPTTDDSEGGIPASVNMRNSEFHVGCDFPGGSLGPQYSNNTISAAFVYDRALSDSEMAVIYASMKTYLAGRSIALP